MFGLYVYLLSILGNQATSSFVHDCSTESAEKDCLQVLTLLHQQHNSQTLRTVLFSPGPPPLKHHCGLHAASQVHYPEQPPETGASIPDVVPLTPNI